MVIRLCKIVFVFGLLVSLCSGAWAGITFLPPVGSYSEMNPKDISMYQPPFAGWTNNGADWEMTGDGGYRVTTNAILMATRFVCPTTSVWEDVPHHIWFMGGWNSNIPNLTGGSEKIWNVTGTHRWKENGMAYGHCLKVNAAAMNAYTGSVSRALDARGWVGSSCSASLTTGDKNNPLANWYPWKDLMSYITTRLNYYNTTQIGGVVAALADCYGEYTIECTYRQAGGQEVRGCYYKFQIDSSVLYWDGKLDGLKSVPDVNKAFPDGSDPNAIVTPDAPSDSSGFLAGFWDNFCDKLKSIFVPTEAKVDELKMVLKDWCNLAPIAIIQEFVDGLNDTENAVNVLGSDDENGENELGYTPRIIHFGVIDLPSGLPSLPIELDIGIWMPYIRFMRLFMGIALWVWFSFNVWNRFKGVLGYGS